MKPLSKEIEMKNIIAIIALITFATAAVAAQKPGTVPTVNLNVAIDDSVSQTAGIRSDNGGTYVNGTAGVKAAFGSNGYLVFNSGTRQVTALYSVQPMGEP